MSKFGRLAMLSVHTSPLAALGGKKTGGMNLYVREVAREIGRRGIQVDVFTRRVDAGADFILMSENVRLIQLSAGPAETLDPAAIYRYLPQFRDELFTFAAGQPYDMIYSHYWLSGWVASTLQAEWGTPFVHMFHTLGRMKDRIADQNQVMDTPTIHMHERNIRVAGESEIEHQADRLIAATPAERAQLVWLYRADRRKIDIVPPGVDTDHFRPIEAAQARARIGLNERQRMLLFVGRIEPIKGVENICRALALLKDNTPNMLDQLSIQIVGGNDPFDEEVRRLQALCRQLDLDDIVKFAGAKDQDILPYYYNAAEALIMPSDYESFGMVALEAMACGTPVIASQVGGLAFLVQDDITGYHVPVREPEALAERIHLLLSDPHHRQRMGQQARRMAEGYCWASVVDQLMTVFELTAV